MADTKIKYGVINENSFSLRSPRGIDGDECDNLPQAMAQVVEMITDGAEQVTVVHCKYSAKREGWFEFGSKRLSITAHGDWSDAEEEG